MPSLEAAIYQILRSKSIVEYLDLRGHSPVKSLTGGKLQYLCPFPDHQETRPSFVVYTESEFENFHCYGCQRSYHIIHLVAGLEGLEFRDAVAKLCKDLDINPTESIELDGKRQIDIINDRFKPNTEIESAIISASSMVRSFLKGVKNDPKECEIIDKVLQSLDDDIKEFNFEGVFETIKYLPAATIKRRIVFEKKKMQELYERRKNE